MAWLKSADGANFTVKGNEIDINDKLAIAVRKNDIWQAKINTALANIRQMVRMTKSLANILVKWQLQRRPLQQQVPHNNIKKYLTKVVKTEPIFTKIARFFVFLYFLLSFSSF